MEFMPNISVAVEASNLPQVIPVRWLYNYVCFLYCLFNDAVNSSEQAYIVPDGKMMNE
jgi:hypothetical protein